MTRKIDFTTEAVVCKPSDSALPLTFRPSLQATTPMTSAMNGALIMPTSKCVDRDRLPQADDEDRRAHAAIEPGDEAAAEERRHRAEEGQDRQGDDQREHARQDQDFDRVEAHGAQRVDLLAHLHRAELGGVGAARAARDHDGDDQHADLAQHQDADQIDDVVLGAELAEMEDALLRDDRADQEGDQQDDADRLPADAIEVMHDGGEAKRARSYDRAAGRLAQGAAHADELNEVVGRRDAAAAERFESAKDRVPFSRGAACNRFAWRISSSSPR